MTSPNPFGGNPFDPAPAGHSPPGPGQQQPIPRPDEVNTLATLSLVFAFILAPAGAFLGHLGLSQIARTAQRGRDRALIGVTLSYVLITAAVVSLVVWAALGHNDTSVQAAAPAPTSAVATPTTTTAATTTTTPPPPTVAPLDLAGLLPTVEDVRKITDHANLTVTETDDHITPDTGTLDNDKCWGVLSVAASHVYDIPAVVGAATTDIRDQSNPVHNPFGTTQSAVAFHDAKAAQQQVTALVNSWRECARATFTSTGTDGHSYTYAAGDPIAEPGGITTIEYRQIIKVSGEPLRMVRAVAVKANVVVDVLAGSRRTGSNQHDVALTIVNFILDRIPGPR
jgi:eukaryotic-like serine/threonine-protein kinase